MTTLISNDNKFVSIISACDNIESKHISNNNNFIKIKEKISLLGHSYIDITELIDNIININKELSEEIFKLKKSLIDYNIILNEKITKLENDNKELKLQITKLENDNKDLKSSINVLEIQNLQLIKDINELKEDKQKHKDMMVIREIVVKFNDIITMFILNKNGKLNNIIYNRDKLNKEQLSKLELFENELKCSSKDLVWYLSQLKRGGNIDAHEKFQDANLHITNIKIKLTNYVREHYHEEVYNEFDSIIDLMIEKIKTKYGEYPFKEKIKKPKI